MVTIHLGPNSISIYQIGREGTGTGSFVVNYSIIPRSVHYVDPLPPPPHSGWCPVISKRKAYAATGLIIGIIRTTPRGVASRDRN